MSERNKLIVETYLNYVKDKKTVAFCASVRHANQISGLFKQQGINCEAASRSMKYELIDLFNWQDEVKGMISQLEFVKILK